MKKPNKKQAIITGVVAAVVLAGAGTTWALTSGSTDDQVDQKAAVEEVELDEKSYDQAVTDLTAQVQAAQALLDATRDQVADPAVWAAVEASVAAAAELLEQTTPSMQDDLDDLTSELESSTTQLLEQLPALQATHDLFVAQSAGAPAPGPGTGTTGGGGSTGGGSTGGGGGSGSGGNGSGGGGGGGGGVPAPQPPAPQPPAPEPPAPAPFTTGEAASRAGVGNTSVATPCYSVTGDRGYNWEGLRGRYGADKQYQFSQVSSSLVRATISC